MTNLTAEEIARYIELSPDRAEVAPVNAEITLDLALKIIALKRRVEELEKKPVDL